MTWTSLFRSAVAALAVSIAVPAAAQSVVGKDKSPFAALALLLAGHPEPTVCSRAG
jgi:hypothetical protein